ncbi:hypothetical protein MNB_SUP05-10-158 [hydrothermal vent metagenome]|uniref:Uncharacterized protein n=1 Tax=hydrothermal vent metagenome TaxID=652676 RepID=A0A1W1DC75_9ZZZZ
MAIGFLSTQALSLNKTKMKKRLKILAPKTMLVGYFLISSSD